MKNIIDTLHPPTHWFEFDGDPARYFCTYSGQPSYSRYALVQVHQDTVAPNCMTWKAGSRFLVSLKRLHPVAIPVIDVCRSISDQATEMMEKSRWSGQRMGDQIMVGRRGVEEGIVGEHLAAFSTAVAKGATPQAAYDIASTGLRSAIERFNDRQEWQVKRGTDTGQDILRFAFWRLQYAHKKSGGIE